MISYETLLQTRRNLLKALSVTMAKGLTPTAATSVFSLAFPRDARSRLAVTSWPFRKYIRSPENKAFDVRQQAIDLKDFPNLVAKRFGVYNINPLASHFSSTDSEYLEAFSKAVEKAGCHIVDLGLSGRNFFDPDMSKRAEAVEYGKKWIDIATILRSPSVRQHLSGHGQPNLALAVSSLSQLAEYGAKRNVVVLLENDNPIAEDPFFLVQVIKRVSSHYLRALPDFGNCLIRHDEAYNERAVKAMFGYAYNMAHVKDVVSSEDGRLVPVDLAKMFDIAKHSGYQGYFSMEYDIDAGDPSQGTEKLIRQSLRYLV